jgi:hypothetical protein
MARAVALAAAILAAAAASASMAGAAPDADPGLGATLKQGGLVLVLRHAATDFSKPDQDPVDLTDCRMQRNLSRRVAPTRVQSGAGRGA